MSDIITTLHEKGNPENAVYPNIKGENIPENAITTAKVNDNAITNEKINDGAISTAKIQDGAITGNKIPLNTISNTKLNFHLYEHNIIVADDNDLNEASEVLIFKVLTNDATPYIDTTDIALLLYERGFDLDKPLMATGRYSDDSFEVVTGIDWGNQSDTTDYCETYIVGVYGTSAEELKAVVSKLSENETTKIFGVEINSHYFYDNVVQLF